MAKPRHLYISATRQDCGKTTVMLGLLQALRDAGRGVGYIKPVGQRYVQFEGLNVDEDAVLARLAFNLADHPADMSPIAIERGFTEHYIFHRDPKPLEDRITAAAARLEAAHDVLAIEGTGHAGVGSCFDLSNARVAQLLNAAVVIITDGGIGRALDEVALSLDLFAKHGVPVLGVILNKTWPEKLPKIQAAVAEGLRHMGTRLVGVLPYRPQLVQPHVGQIVEEIGCHILSGADFLENRVEHTVIAAMSPEHVAAHMRRGTLMITPGDRLDTILMSTTWSTRSPEMGPPAGLILTGGFEPPAQVMETLASMRFPVVLCDGNTYTVAARLGSLKFKLRPQDTDKIAAAKALVRDSLDVSALMEALAGCGPQ
jgi:BioD-like phosphotransacetylase family protein